MHPKKIIARSRMRGRSKREKGKNHYTKQGVKRQEARIEARQNSIVFQSAISP